MMRTALALLLGSLLVMGCSGAVTPLTGGGGGGPDGGTGADSGGSGSCTVAGGCGLDQICGFLASDTSCLPMEMGTCLPAPEIACGLFSPGCACDGETINIACNGLPDGYVTEPLAYVGACGQPEPPVDAGSGPACTTSSDCGVGNICGFPASDGCAATGQCFPQGPLCELFAPGCACDGQTIDIACNGLPSGYETAPLLHDGECDPADAL
jgi:hypothetical protein